MDATQATVSTAPLPALGTAAPGSSLDVIGRGFTLNAANPVYQRVSSAIDVPHGLLAPLGVHETTRLTDVGSHLRHTASTPEAMAFGLSMPGGFDLADIDPFRSFTSDHPVLLPEISRPLTLQHDISSFHQPFAQPSGHVHHRMSSPGDFYGYGLGHGRLRAPSALEVSEHQHTVQGFTQPHRCPSTGELLGRVHAPSYSPGPLSAPSPAPWERLEQQRHVDGVGRALTRGEVRVTQLVVHCAPFLLYLHLSTPYRAHGMPRWPNPTAMNTVWLFLVVVWYARHLLSCTRLSPCASSSPTSPADRITHQTIRSRRRGSLRLCFPAGVSPPFAPHRGSETARRGGDADAGASDGFRPAEARNGGRSRGWGGDGERRRRRSGDQWRLELGVCF